MTNFGITLKMIMKESLFSSGAANVQFYLFGSILKGNCRPNDIDILILYDDKLNNIYSVINLRKTLRERLKCIFNLPIDITLLSYKENEEINFIESENARFFYSASK